MTISETDIPLPECGSKKPNIGKMMHDILDGVISGTRHPSCPLELHKELRELFCGEDASRGTGSKEPSKPKSFDCNDTEYFIADAHYLAEAIQTVRFNYTGDSFGILALLNDTLEDRISEAMYGFFDGNLQVLGERFQDEYVLRRLPARALFPKHGSILEFLKDTRRQGK